MNTRLCLLIALVAWYAPAPSAASGADAPQAISPTTPADDPVRQIPATLQALKEAKAGKYGKLRAEDKQRLDAADRDIDALVASHEDLRQLDEQERLRLFNAQETIMAIVSGLKRSQLICTYRANAGTRFKTKQCMTHDMAEAIRKAAKDGTHAAQNPMCIPSDTNPCSR